MSVIVPTGLRAYQKDDTKFEVSWDRTVMPGFIATFDDSIDGEYHDWSRYKVYWDTLFQDHAKYSPISHEIGSHSRLIVDEEMDSTLKTNQTYFISVTHIFGETESSKSTDYPLVLRILPAEHKEGILGSGFAFPFIFAGDGGVRVSDCSTNELLHLKHCILQILLTNHYERVMRANFGANLRDAVFEPIHPTVRAVIEFGIMQALRSDPRIAVANFKLIDVEDKLLVYLEFEAKESHQRASFVFPYYLLSEVK